MKRLRQATKTRNRSCRRAMRTVYKSVVIMALAAAYLWQVFEISSGYFAYTTSNRLTYAESGSATPIPSVDVCHALPINHSLQSVQQFKGRIIGEILTRNHQGNVINMTDSCFTYSYRIYQLLCLSISIHGRHPKEASFERRRQASQCSAGDSNSSSHAPPLQSTDLLSFSLNPCYQQQVMGVEKVLVTLHSPTVKAYDPSSNIIKMHEREPQAVYLAYSVVMLHRMPVPYDTNCRQHPPDHSTRDCFEACYSRRVKQEFRAHPVDSPRDVSVSKVIDPRKLQPQQRSRLNATWNSCRKGCGKECIKPLYFLRLMLQRYERGLFTFTMTRAREIVTLITSSAKTTLFDLISVCLNGASFWIAFCPATWLLSRRLQRIFRRRHAKVRGKKPQAFFTVIRPLVIVYPDPRHQRRL